MQSTLSQALWEVGDSAGEVPSHRGQNFLVTVSRPPDPQELIALG